MFPGTAEFPDTVESNASGKFNVSQSHRAPSQSPAVVDYVTDDGRASHTYDVGIDPYEQAAENGAPGQSRNLGRDNHNSILTHGTLMQNVSFPSAAKHDEYAYTNIFGARNTTQYTGVAEEDYSHLDDAQKTQRAREVAADNYSHLYYP